MAPKPKEEAARPSMTDFRVAQIVRKRMRTTRKEVEEATYLDPEKAVKRLIASGIVESHRPGVRARISRAGAPPQLLTLGRNLGYMIGVDIGHRAVSVSITRAEFHSVLDEPFCEEVPYLDDNPKLAFDAAAKLVREAIAAAQERDGLRAEEVIGIGVGVPAPINRTSQKVESEMHILSAWSEYKPAEEIHSRLADLLPNVAVEVDNDASLGALGIYSWGLLNADVPTDVARDLIYVRVGDGIGAGVVVKGKLVGGGSGYAGEIGHVKVDERGRFCPRCGQRGCVETKASDRAVLEEVAPTAFAARPDEVSIEEAVEATHPACFRALQEAGWYLGVALAHARTLLDPTRIILGGPLAGSSYYHAGVVAGMVSNSINLKVRGRDVVSPAPVELRERRPDLGSPEMLGAIAIAVHRCGDTHIRRKLGIDTPA